MIRRDFHAVALLTLAVAVTVLMPSRVDAQTTPPASNVRPNEAVVLFATAASLDATGTRWRIPLHAWVHIPATDSRVRKAAFATVLKSKWNLAPAPATQSAFDRRVSLLFADNKRGKQLVIEVAGQRLELPATQPNGHVEHAIELPATAVAAAAREGILTLRVLLPAGDSRDIRGRVHLIGPRGVSLISDIDDTVKVTGVLDRKQLLDNTFLQPFAPVPGMAAAYRRLIEPGPVEPGAGLHFVSSSPWHLHSPLREMLDGGGFPPATLDLKQVRLKDRTILDLFKPGLETKPPVIEALLARWPQRTFVLIGDSGEQDPEVLARVFRRNPGRIDRILIRNVTAARPDDARFTAVFAGIERARWQLFERPEEIK